MNKAPHVCLSCKREVAPVRGHCPSCGGRTSRSEAMQRVLADYDRGLDRRTSGVGSLSIVPENGGHYFAVFDSRTGSKLMCGFDTFEQAFAYCIHRGHMPVQTDADVLKLLNLMDLSEKKQ